MDICYKFYGGKPMIKSKSERFYEIAGNRTNRIIADLRLLGNCANKNNYEYTDEDVKKMFTAIEAALKESKAKFNKTKSKEKFKF